jgi:hypothetical protein
LRLNIQEFLKASCAAEEIKQTENNQHANALPLHQINIGFYDWIYSESHQKCKRPTIRVYIPVNQFTP